jgi:hypothetical protein
MAAKLIQTLLLRFTWVHINSAGLCRSRRERGERAVRERGLSRAGDQVICDGDQILVLAEDDDSYVD